MQDQMRALQEEEAELAALLDARRRGEDVRRELEEARERMESARAAAHRMPQPER